MDYLDHLNEPQRAGVVNTEGPTMIIAGAGSGKTRVLTYRIAHLIREKQVDPFNILSLTFTNKAAKEMRERIEKVVGAEARNLYMGTFHSVFARILRSEAHLLGYPSSFTILDSDDTKSLIKTIVKEMGLDDKIYKPGVVYSRISGAKNRLISWQSYLQNPQIKADDESNMKPKMGQIYKAYCERCFKSGAMDFDDLLFNTNRLFREHTEVLNRYQQQFKYVMVDEFQDTNYSQYLITKKLSAVRQNICVVGDDAQSIYAFRGADIQNILNFEKDYPELNTIKLEQNYRSTKTIVNAANSVIGKNKAQLKKDVWTTNDDGELITLIKSASDNEEGKLIASAIFEEKMQRQLQNLDFAILYRTNSQSRAIEEALRRNGIKYKIIGGLSFYSRKEIKDVLAYLRFTLNTNDETSFKRIINLPKRGIGATTVDKILVGTQEQDISLWEALNHSNQFVPGRAANQILDFTTMIKRFKMEVEKKDAYQAAMDIAKSSGLLRDLYADKSIEGISRYENVQELMNAIQDFVENSESEDKSLEAFLQEVTLLTGVDNDKDDDPDKVTLMTIHMAKGLEFKNVFIAGMEEDLFPSQMMMNSRKDLEEERRLFYVAITRAETKLFLSYALSRYRFGRLKNCEPSRFIEDIDAKYIKMERKLQTKPVEFSGANLRPSMNENKEGYAKSLVAGMKKQQRAPVRSSYVPPTDFEPSDTSNLTAGMKVEHQKFGYGTVVEIDDKGANVKAKVKFNDHGEKTLLLSFAKLKIHS